MFLLEHGEVDHFQNIGEMTTQQQDHLLNPKGTTCHSQLTKLNAFNILNIFNVLKYLFMYLMYYIISLLLL